VTGPVTPTEVSKILRGCAAVVVPSTAPEALPLVVLEAFAHGRPVVTLSVSGLDDVVDGDVGWVSAPTPDDLAETLRQAADGDLDVRGSAARASYEARFAPDVVMQAQLDIYRSVIAERLGSR
jgi:glycosyltransferase involved in cell wall biosynthesis